MSRRIAKSRADALGPGRLDAYLFYWIGQIDNLYKRAILEALRPLRINLAWWRTLAVLTERGPVTTGDLARITVIERTALTRVVDQMRITNSRVTIVAAGRSGTEKALGEFADKPGWTIKEEHKEAGGTPGGAAQSSEAFITEDGVTTALAISVQGLELQGTAVSIEKLPRPDCRK